MTVGMESYFGGSGEVGGWGDVFRLPGFTQGVFKLSSYNSLFT